MSKKKTRSYTTKNEAIDLIFKEFLEFLEFEKTF